MGKGNKSPNNETSDFVIDGARIPKGNYQTVDLSTAKAAPSIPSSARVAILQAIGNDISWRDDGTTATVSSGGSFGGMILKKNTEFLYVGDLSKLSFIEAVSTSTSYLNIAYYA